MSRAATSVLAVGLGLAAAIALISCGGGDAKLLPGTTAKEITENLESVRELAAEGQCVDAEDAAQQVSTQVEALQGIHQAEGRTAEGRHEAERSRPHLHRSDDRRRHRRNAADDHGNQAHQAREGKEAEGGKAEAAQGNRARTTRRRRNRASLRRSQRARRRSKRVGNALGGHRPGQRNGWWRLMAGGTLSGRYELGDRLGSGGMSRCLQAQRPDPRADRRGEDPRRAPIRRRSLRRSVPPRGAGRAS